MPQYSNSLARYGRNNNYMGVYNRYVPYHRLARSAYRVGKKVYDAARKRRRTAKSNGSRTGTYAVANRTSVTTRKAARNKKKFGRKTKKPVKVSQALQKKIKHVMKNEEDHAVGTHVVVPRVQIERMEVTNKKTWFVYPFNKNAVGSNPGSEFGVLHSWRLLQYAANRLFFNQGALEFPGLNLNDGALNSKTGTVEVLYHKATYYIKNNSERTYRVGMFKCTAKKNMGGPDVPMRRWDNAYVNEAGNLQPEDNFVEGFLRPVNVDSYRQVLTEWAHTPRYYQQFREYFDMEEIKIVLDPGQTIEQVVHLPTGSFTGADYFTDQTYLEHHKGSITVMFSIMPDVVQAVDIGNPTAVGEAGYWVDPAGSAGGPGVLNPEKGLIFECKIQRKLKLPEETAGIVRATTVGQTHANNLRTGPRYAYEEFINTLPTDPYYVRTDEQRPGYAFDE